MAIPKVDVVTRIVEVDVIAKKFVAKNALKALAKVGYKNASIVKPKKKKPVKGK